MPNFKIFTKVKLKLFVYLCYFPMDCPYTLKRKLCSLAITRSHLSIYINFFSSKLCYKLWKFYFCKILCGHMHIWSTIYTVKMFSAVLNQDMHNCWCNPDFINCWTLEFYFCKFKNTAAFIHTWLWMILKFFISIQVYSSEYVIWW